MNAVVADALASAGVDAAPNALFFVIPVTFSIRYGIPRRCATSGPQHALRFIASTPYPQ
jgi:hypothetical protein